MQRSRWAFDVQLKAAGYLGMSGQIVDASEIPR
jgi:hypothetical protein